MGELRDTMYVEKSQLGMGAWSDMLLGTVVR